MITILAYKCDHCKRYGIDKGTISKHETRCYYNPETRSCGTCEHLLNFKSCCNGVDISAGLKTVCDGWELHNDLIEE